MWAFGYFVKCESASGAKLKGVVGRGRMKSDLAAQAVDVLAIYSPNITVSTSRPSERICYCRPIDDGITNVLYFGLEVANETTWQPGSA